MSTVQMLRALVKQRLTAAAEDIFGLFERTIAEYEETLCRSKEENERQRRLLDAVFNPQLRLHRAAADDESTAASGPGVTSQETTADNVADVEQLLVNKEEVPAEHQQEWSPSLDQEDPEPPHIKEEQEEVWTNPEQEQLQGLEEVKEKEDEEKPQSSQLHQRQTEQMKTEADGDDCGGPEPDRNSHPDTEDKTEETEVSDAADDESTAASGPGVTSQETTADNVADVEQLLVNKEEVPAEHQQEWSPSLDQEDPEPPHIKEEQEEVWTNPEQEQLQGLEEVKEKEDEEKPQSSQLHQRQTEQMKTEADGDDCGGPEPDRNSHPDTEDKTEETEVSDGEWEETRGPQSGLNSLKSDLRCDPDEKPFSCSECGKTFIQKVSLITHTTTHTGEKLFTCSVCGKTFACENYLRQHTDVHTGVKQFNCRVCGKSFMCCSQLRIHHCVGESSFICPECGRRFGRRVSLERHMRTHTGQKPHRCSVCGLSFTHKGHLTSRMAVHVERSSCSVCEKSLTSKLQLKSTQLHTANKRFTCSRCDKKFARKQHLQVHMRTHTGEKPYSCSVCGKKYSRSENLNLHMKLHIREKNFNGSVCKTSTSVSLVKHMRSHTAETPFSCSLCVKTFTFKRYLTQHMAVHTGEKRYSCRNCDERFTWYSQLRRHKCGGELSQLHENQ